MLSALLDTISLWRLLSAVILTALPGYILYQTWLHPLACYPGPIFAKLTDLYSVVHAFRGDRHEDLYKLHQHYGRIVRIGPCRVSICDVQALQPIYGFRANVQKAQWYQGFYGESIFNAIDRKIHARKRRVMSPAFSDQAVQGMEPLILSAVRDWCLALGDRHLDMNNNSNNNNNNKDWSQPKDMAHWSACVAFDALGEICFGSTFNASLSSANHFFFPLMALNVRILNICGQMPVLRRLGLDRFLRMNTEANRNRQIAFSRQQLAARLAANPSQRRDIVYYLQQARVPATGEAYSQQELVSEVTLLLGAGAETASTALAATFYFLSHHPAILSRLTTEIRDAFPTVEAIVPGPRLSGLVFLRACIDESMRLCPPIPMDLPRQVLSGGLQVGDVHLPAGTVVGVPTYTLHHSDEYFVRPFTFDPDRWLLRGFDGGAGDGIETGVNSEALARQRQAFVPFILGPRACIGKNVAMVELELSIARVLWLYDVRLAPGSEDLGVGREGEYKTKDNFIVSKVGPVLQFRYVLGENS